MNQNPSSPRLVLSPIRHIPYARNPNFTGRHTELSDIETAFQSGEALQSIQSIYGLGGVGKTQLALEFVYRHRQEYAIVWWVRADESTTMLSDFLRLGERISNGTVHEVPPDILCEAIRRSLERRNDWLLILDNVPGLHSILPILPQANTGHILITSRSPNWRGIGRPVQLSPWTRDESVEFLHKRTGEGSDDVPRLAEELGDLPLALEQAGACIEQSRISCSSYLERFRTHRQQLLRLTQPDTEYSDTVATTWNISFDRVSGASRSAGDLLNLIAFLAPDEIRRDLIAGGSRVLPFPLSATVADPVALDGAISALLQYSLIDARDESLSLHRLVAACTRDRLSDMSRQRWAESALALVNEAFSFESLDINTWANCSALLPHVLAASAHAESLGAAPSLNAALLNDAGRYLLSVGQFRDALGLLDRSLKLSRSIHGDKHPQISSIVNDLGRAHTRLGNFEEARHFYEWALAIDEPRHGHNHPHVATIVNNYGMCLASAGNAEKAKEHFEWALAVFEQAYGAEHVKVASIMNNLGFALRELGDLESARAYFERALPIAESAAGPTHPMIASILHNLGAALRLSGDYAAARPLFERALAIDESAYRADHPDVMRDVFHLGQILRELADLDAARAHYERALIRIGNIYGSQHPRTIELQRLLDEVYAPMSEAMPTNAAATPAPLIPDEQL